MENSSLDRSLVADAGDWKELDPKLSDISLEAVASLGFQQMTPVQASTIPLFLRNKDVVVEAVTGSGKTLAFLIPVLEILYRRQEKLKKNQVGAIIISPTRELAKQIHQVLEQLLEHATFENMKSLLITGGRPVEEDIAEFKQHGASILIATPGKLEELLKNSLICTRELEVLVLDEADRLLDLGFEKSLRQIIQRLPKQRRTGLFSATMTDALAELIKAGLRNPVRIVVKVEDKDLKKIQRTPSTLTITYVECESDEKMLYMMEYLKRNPNSKFIVYYCTCSCVDYYYKILSALPQLQGIDLFSLHGKMDPKRRISVYEKFTSSSSGVLLCTDVAARGLDIPDVDFVIQMDPPQDPQAFLHRCGRTARQGRSGKAIVFLLPQENSYIDFLTYKKIPITAETPPPITPTEYPPITLPSFYQLPGKRLDSTNETQTIEKPSMAEYVHHHLLADRDFYLKSVISFVSFLKSYQEHQLKFIFRFNKLDIPRLMNTFFLLTVPRSPELKKLSHVIKESPVFKARILDTDQDKIAFKDKTRERQRLQNLQELQKKKLAGKFDGKKRFDKLDAWSDKKAAKEKKLERREKKERKRKFLQQQASGMAASTTDEPDADENDWDDLRNEARLMKKLKSGKITQEEFNTQVDDDDKEE